MMPIQVIWKFTGNYFLENEAVIFGKLIITKRKVAWYGDTTFIPILKELSKP
jgi:hypothetical protein